MPLYIYPAKGGGDTFIHGDLGKHCADCSRAADQLCDYPIGGGKTCDRSLCEHHGHVVGDDMHYCDTHYREWRANNPGKPDYRLTRYRVLTLPGFSSVVMDWLKKEIDRRVQALPDVPADKLRHAAAIMLGIDFNPAERHPDPEPLDSLEHGLAWLIHAGLVQPQRRKRHDDIMPRWHFMLTDAGLRVANGKTVEARR